MPPSPLLLGLDVGTSRTKALLVDEAGRDVALAVVATPFRDRAGAVEMGVDDLRDAVAHVLADLGTARRRVAGVGVAGIAESGAPLDGGGHPLAPVIAWHDPRGGDVVAALHERLGAGLDRRIGQRLRTVSSVAKLGWLVDHGAGRVWRWLGVPELVVHALTGATATEHSLAARTGAWDVAEGRYIPEVGAALGLPLDVFAPVTPAGQAAGRVTPPASAWSGLGPGTPVTLAGHDHLAGMAGAGAARHDLVNSVGTAETVVGRSALLPDLDLALSRRAAVTVPPGGEGWAVLCSAARSGLVLDAVAGALGRPLGELDRLAAGTGAVDAEAVVDAVAAGEPPALPPGSPGEVWNGVLRGLAARTWEAAHRAQEVAGRADRLVVVGGGSRSRPWLEAKAALGPLPVWRCAAPEAVARGAALWAGTAAGWWASPTEAPAAPLARA